MPAILNSLAVVLLAVSTASAIFLPYPKIAEYTDTFDNLPPASGLSSVGIVNGIDYSQFNVATLDALSGAVPPSSPNVAAVELLSSVASGDLSLSPSATAKVAPGTKAFDLLQFYFACNIAQGVSEVAVEEGCTIAVTGYNTKGVMVGEAPFSFAPPELEGSPFVKAILPPTFVDLVNVTFGVANAAVATSLTVIGLDNITHVNYY